MLLFKSPGLVSYNANNPVLLTIEGFRTEQGLYLENMSGEIQPNFQLSYAIGNAAFLTSFHQRLGMFVFNGFHSNQDCTDSTANRGRTRKPPFFDFYLKNNINTRSSPMRIVFSGTVMLGYIISLNIGGARRTPGLEGASYSFRYLGAFREDVSGLLAENPPFTPSGSAAGSGGGGGDPKKDINQIFQENGWTSPVNAGATDPAGNVLRPAGLATTGGTF
ncbi:MAG TPA: hypothetical protein VM537_15460 [Anaerolineae bacterium]|nr:hypothetical protein [Anaerolineae bacterium]